MSIWRRRAGAVALVAAVTTVAACSTAPNPPDSGSPTTSRTAVYDKPATLDRIEVEDPAWGSEDAPVESIGSIEITGSIAVVAGSTAERNSVVTALDARTGQQLWSVEVLAELPGENGDLFSRNFALVGSGKDALVLVEYYASTCDAALCPPGSIDTTAEHGIAALSITDGSVRWKYPAIPAVPTDTAKAEALQGRDVELVEEPGDYPLAVVGPSIAVNGSQYVEPKKIRTVALDPATGDPVWTRKKRWARRVVDDVVIATIPLRGTAGAVRSSKGPLVGLDPATGKQLWNRADDYGDIQLLDTTKRSVVIADIDGGRTVHVLNASDGRSRLNLGKRARPTGGTGPLVVWPMKPLDTRPSLMSLADSEKQPVTSAHPLPADVRSNPVLVHGGYIFYGTDTYSVALDRSGNVVSERIPGRVLAMTDDLLVTRKPNEKLAVYRLDN